MTRVMPIRLNSASLASQSGQTVCVGFFPSKMNAISCKDSKGLNEKELSLSIRAGTMTGAAQMACLCFLPGQKEGRDAQTFTLGSILRPYTRCLLIIVCVYEVEKMADGSGTAHILLR